MEWLTAGLAAVVTISTAVIGWLKFRDKVRFTTIEEQLAEARKERTEAKSRVRELEERIKTLEVAHRLDATAWDKERIVLLQELTGLRSAVARLEVGATAAIVIANAEGDIIDCNPMTGEMFGWSKEELVGRDIRVLVPFRFRADHHSHFSEVASGKRAARKEPLEAFALSRTGHEVPVVITLSSWEEDGQKFFGAELKHRRP